VSAEFASLGTATVYEAAGREGLVDCDLVQIVPGSSVAGPARTVRCGQDDNLMVHAAMAALRPGEVLVLTMPEPAPVGIVGELLATQAQVKGAAAILVDAAVRDVPELEAMGLPIWARFIRARGATKSVVGELDVAVTVGGAVIHPGDVVCCDTDGAVVVAAQRRDEVLQAARAREQKERAKRDRLREGALSYDLDGLRQVVEGQ
jgi:4-hydroxy-4-methyl-2-oxoglutarate aldolase